MSLQTKNSVKKGNATKVEDVSFVEREKLAKLIQRLTDGLIEREQEVHLAVLAMLAGEHILLIGPPGTAKSEIARRLTRALRGGEIFERLLTRFSVPEDIFGPLSLKALEEDRYERQTKGYLPSASVAFIDEIFKANSAILNALLTVMNERKFDNGTIRQEVPLLAMVAASNELPEEEVLQALYDRFLIRCHVNPVSDAGFYDLLRLSDGESQEIEDDLRFSASEIEQIQKKAREVKLPDAVVASINSMRRFLISEEIYVSDRRWRKAVKLLKVAAFTNGQEEVTQWECWLLQHCLWNSPEEREVIQKWYDARVGAESPERPGQFLRLVAGFERFLKSEQSAVSQSVDKEGRPLFRTADGKTTSNPRKRTQKRNSKGEPLFLAPSGEDRSNGGQGYTEQELRNDHRFIYDRYNNEYFRGQNGRISKDEYFKEPASYLLVAAEPIIEPTRYSPAHINGRLTQVDEQLAQAKAHLKNLNMELDALEERIESHLWIDPDFAETALAGLIEAHRETTSIKERLEKVRKGFAELPVRNDDFFDLEA